MLHPNPRHLRASKSQCPSQRWNAILYTNLCCQIRVHVVGTENGAKPHPVPTRSVSNDLSPVTPNSATALEKVIVDPTRGGQVKAKEKAAIQLLALSVPDRAWVWVGAISVLLVDLFRYTVYHSLKELPRFQRYYWQSELGDQAGSRDGIARSDQNARCIRWHERLIPPHFHM